MLVGKLAKVIRRTQRCEVMSENAAFGREVEGGYYLDFV